MGLILSLVFYSCTILKEYEVVELKIQQDYIDVAAALRGEGAVVEIKPVPFTKETFEKWLNVRDAVAESLDVGFADRKATAPLLQRRVRNDALKSLQETLTAQQLSFAAYNNASMRWRSLIARPEFPTLHEAWGKEVRVASSPVPLPLEEPAADITELERSLLKESEARLIKTLSADKLTVLAELIASTEEPPTE